MLRIDSTALHSFVLDRLSLLNKTERDLAKAVGVEFEFELESIMRGSFGGPVKKSDLAPIAKFIEQDVDVLFSLVPVADRGDGNTPKRRKRTMEPIEIRIDGISYKVDQTAGPHIDKAIADRDAKITVESARADAAEAKIADLTKERDTEKARADAASNPEAISKMVQDRSALLDKARTVLGKDAKLDGDDQTIKIAAIKHTDSKFESEGKTVDYINARFDMIDAKAATTAGKGAAAQALAAARADGGTGGATEEKTDAASAQRKDSERSANAWQQPLAASKDAPVAKA